MNWVVSVDRDAVAAWVALHQPNPSDRAVMEQWFDHLADTGPPPIIGWANSNNPVARAPGGESVEFTQIPKPLIFGTDPPYGIIGIHSIG